MWFCLKSDYTQSMCLFIDGQGHLWWRLKNVLEHLEPMHLLDTLPYQRIRDIIPSKYHYYFVHSELMEKVMSDRDVLVLFQDFNEMLHQSLLKLFQEGKVKETMGGCPTLEQCHHMGERFKDVLQAYKARAIQLYNRSPLGWIQEAEHAQHEPLEEESEDENAQNEPLEADSGIEDESPSEEDSSTIVNGNIHIRCNINLRVK